MENKSTKTTELFRNVLCQLLAHTSKDKLRKVCESCHELGHSSSSITCKINVDKKENLKSKIKAYILASLTLEDINIILEITLNYCKTLYDEISPM